DDGALPEADFQNPRLVLLVAPEHVDPDAVLGEHAVLVQDEGVAALRRGADLGDGPQAVLVLREFEGDADGLPDVVLPEELDPPRAGRATLGNRLGVGAALDHVAVAVPVAERTPVVRHDAILEGDIGEAGFEALEEHGARAVRGEGRRCEIGPRACARDLSAARDSNARPAVTCGTAARPD